VVWGEQARGRFNRLRGGLVTLREDKEDREQAKLLRGLGHLPHALAKDEDCIIKPDAHPALVTPELFEACRRRREENRTNYSAPRCPRGRKGHVWPLAGQMKCGHCGQPVWTLPGGDEGGRRDYVDCCRVACSARRAKGPAACPHSGMAPYPEVLGRVITLLK